MSARTWGWTLLGGEPITNNQMTVLLVFFYWYLNSMLSLMWICSTFWRTRVLDTNVSQKYINNYKTFYVLKLRKQLHLSHKFCCSANGHIDFYHKQSGHRFYHYPMLPAYNFLSSSILWYYNERRTFNLMPLLIPVPMPFILCIVLLSMVVA